MYARWCLYAVDKLVLSLYTRCRTSLHRSRIPTCTAHSTAPSPIVAQVSEALYFIHFYLRQGGYVFARLCLSVCLCVSKITQKAMDGSFWNFEGYVGNGTNYQWFNFGADPEGILDSELLWNFRYHCFQWGIKETATKPKMVLPPSEQHCLGGGVRALTAF